MYCNATHLATLGGGRSEVPRHVPQKRSSNMTPVSCIWSNRFVCWLPLPNPSITRFHCRARSWQGCVWLLLASADDGSCRFSRGSKTISSCRALRSNKHEAACMTWIPRVSSRCRGALRLINRPIDSARHGDTAPGAFLVPPWCPSRRSVPLHLPCHYCNSFHPRPVLLYRLPDRCQRVRLPGFHCFLRLLIRLALAPNWYLVWASNP